MILGGSNLWTVYPRCQHLGVAAVRGQQDPRVERWMWALVLEGPGAVWICFLVQWDGATGFWSLR